jgi:predicted DNA-binding transcriptional regulator AlpA
MSPYMNRQEIAERLGLTLERMRKTVEAQPSFPRPALRLSRKTVLWDRSAIHRWEQSQRAKA